MRIATAAPAADDWDDDEPRRGADSAARSEAAMRELLEAMVTAKFGLPPTDISARLQSLTAEELKSLSVSLLTAASWDELLNSM